MKAKIFLIGCSAMFMGVSNGCSKSPLNPLGDCGGGNWIQQVESSLTQWSQASNDLSNDPTPANCTKYKSAGKNYLEALKAFSNCVPGTDKKEFNDAIKEAKKELDESSCNS